MHSPRPFRLSHKRSSDTTNPLGGMLEQVHVPPFMKLFHTLASNKVNGLSHFSSGSQLSSNGVENDKVKFSDEAILIKGEWVYI